MFHMQTLQENIREGNFHFPSYSISISQSSVDTTGKLIIDEDDRENEVT